MPDTLNQKDSTDVAAVVGVVGGAVVLVAAVPGVGQSPYQMVCQEFPQLVHRKMRLAADRVGMGSTAKAG